MIQLSFRDGSICKNSYLNLKDASAQQATSSTVLKTARRKSLQTWCLVALLSQALLPIACPAVITFDDLTPRPSDKIPFNYQGLHFSGSPYNGITKSSTSVIPGVHNGAVSAPNVLLSENQALSIQPFDVEHGATFTFNSGYFTSAYESTLVVEATGFTSGESFTKTLVLTSEHPTFVSFSWQNLTEIEFQGNWAGNNNQFVMDNLTVNENTPEPQTVLLFGIGLVLFSFKRWGGFLKSFTD